MKKLTLVGLCQKAGLLLVYGLGLLGGSAEMAQAKDPKQTKAAPAKSATAGTSAGASAVNVLRTNTTIQPKISKKK